MSLFNVLASLLGAGVLMMAIFQEFDPRAFLFFVFFLAIAETFIQIRWRLAMVCRECGFDPVLYVKKPLDAAAKVKFRLDERKQSPTALLRRSLHLPTISPARAGEVAQSEQALKSKKGSVLNQRA